MGRFRITTHKDRHGYLKRGHVSDFELRSDPATHAISWTFQPVTPEFRPTVLMERISRHLEVLDADVRAPSGDIDTEVKGNNDAKRVGLMLLVAEGYVREEAGKHGARMLSSIRPYRDEAMGEDSPKMGSSPINNSPENDDSSPIEESHSQAVIETSPILVQTSPSSTSPIVRPP